MGALARGANVETRRPLAIILEPHDTNSWEVTGDGITGMTALMYAAQGGCQQIVRKLLLCGAHVNAIEEDGFSALHFAVLEGHAEVCQTLLHGGAKLDMANHEGNTPVMLAQASDEKEFRNQFSIIHQTHELNRAAQVQEKSRLLDDG